MQMNESLAFKMANIGITTAWAEIQPSIYYIFIVIQIQRVNDAMSTRVSKSISIRVPNSMGIKLNE